MGEHHRVAGPAWLRCPARQQLAPAACLLHSYATETPDPLRNGTGMQKERKNTGRTQEAISPEEICHAQIRGGLGLHVLFFCAVLLPHLPSTHALRCLRAPRLGWFLAFLRSLSAPLNYPSSHNPLLSPFSSRTPRTSRSRSTLLFHITLYFKILNTTSTWPSNYASRPVSIAR